MQGKLIFLLEELSMKTLLDNLLPRLFPGWEEQKHFLCVAHQGKSDLDKSIPRKLKAWRSPQEQVIFVIVRDNDGADCIKQKQELRDKCLQAGRPDTLIRLVCQELESWYLGDLDALDKAFDAKVNIPKNRKRFANPDAWQKPSREVERLVPCFQKQSGARKLAEHLDAQHNRSHSFQVFVKGVSRLARSDRLPSRRTS
ncbi:MAG: DUF4276 family protein [Burkholderiaceae bacterium]|jgi:hypothetical protein|nr:DUF4276 family protein [Burkholderiaceae bacterium]